MQVNAGIWAKQLSVITGANEISAESVEGQEGLRCADPAAIGAAAGEAVLTSAGDIVNAGQLAALGKASMLVFFFCQESYLREDGQ